jgi:hypothetical protein
MQRKYARRETDAGQRRKASEVLQLPGAAQPSRIRCVGVFNRSIARNATRFTQSKRVLKLSIQVRSVQ